MRQENKYNIGTQYDKYPIKVWVRCCGRMTLEALECCKGKRGL